MADGRPALITNAEKSQDEQLRDRRLRYVLMMCARIVLVILAVVLVTLKVPLAWLWALGCIVGGALLPWFAVLLANDRPPKEQHRLRHFFHKRPEPDDPRALEARPHTVVDADE
ncbi:hypothetical protein Afil01_48820 [Actinorhabdospora filicis]|uniref:DUF3099 domain-containing protein n=1 Tax=Actinorhabdospora filicis TaxID=1785913 RepID=A0A9W6WCR7_9ACTN|nr:DUF3099 domain-containing protein [Actinorhabdospora filicis]GLZ80075.1 hypothetical protein Afil01_48820 [Actinorhabdospora filicis]